MSALDEYEENKTQLPSLHLVNEVVADAMRDELLARIAELEAENEAYKSDQRDDFEEDKRKLERKYTKQMKRAEQAEAERDSMYQACKDAGWEVESGNPEKFVATLKAELAERDRMLKEAYDDSCADGSTATLRSWKPPSGSPTSRSAPRKGAFFLRGRGT